MWQSCVVPIVPEEAYQSGKQIHFDDHTKTFTLIQKQVTPGKSPANKYVKLGEDMTHRKSSKKLFTESVLDISTGLTEMDIDSDNMETTHDIFCRMLPIVLNELKLLHGQLDIWEKMLKLIQEGSFPFDNIAYSLFMDVVEFTSLSNTCAMRYSETVKTCWETGYKLFHGKFIHFMSGEKHRYIYNFICILCISWLFL